MAIPSSQSMRSESEMVPELRPVMPVDIFRAAIKGNSDVLIRRLGLEPEEQREIQVTIEASHYAPEQIMTEHQTVQSELQSATRFGDTILHLLVTEGHNELAFKVFRRDVSLLKALNKMLETPLYCAVKIGNKKVIHDLIQIDTVVVKDAIKKTNENGDTTLHVAVKHGHIDVGCELMKLDPEVAYKVNNEMLSPLHIAITKGYTKMVQTMLEVDPTLACTQFSNGMFPVHVAAYMGNKELVMHFMQMYPDDAELRDPRGRNLFHIAVEENQNNLFSGVFEDTSVEEMLARMHNATDYEGNTPLHIAAMKGHKSIMIAIWENKMNLVAETVQNNEGLTPLQLSARQLLETNKNIDDEDISEYVETEGYKFTRKWFVGVMEQPMENKWERTQVIGLGSVLITTVTFAAAFSVPGGYDQDHGTPVLGRNYMFRAFILANALAFIQGFLSLFVLLYGTLIGQFVKAILFATLSFLYAASSMVVAFGLGMYVTLAPVCLPIAIILLVITLFIGSPAALVLVSNKKFIFISFVSSLSYASLGFLILGFYAVPFLLIFCLALL